MSTPPRTSARRSTLETWLPLGYLGMALALILMVIPTALRPPPPPPSNEAPELAPDDPPDEQQPLLQPFTLGSSATAGSGLPSTDGLGAGGALPVPARAELPSACPHGFGRPKRQTESVYGPPCAAAFTGSNGGNTAYGVTATEVRVAVAMANAATATSYEGPVPDSAQSGESPVERTYRVLQAWANQTFQFYGRRVRLYALKPPTGDSQEAQSKANAAGAYKKFELFGSVTIGNQFLCDEFDRLRTVNFCDVARGPVTWSWRMDLDRSSRLTAEYICKSLVNRPAIFTDDPTVGGKPRKFGLVYVTNTTKYADAAKLVSRYLAQGCGGELTTSIVINGSGDQSAAATVANKLRSAGVTTVLSFMDWVTSATFTNGLDAQAYHPEIWVPGMGQMDVNYYAKTQNQAVWAHAMGISSLEMVHSFETTDCYRAFKVIDTDNVPDYTLCTSFFAPFLQMLSGIQAAGPALTPRSFEEGLFRVGYRFYESPRWAVGGGYGPGDYSYAKDVVEVWWDALAPDPDTGDGTTGTPGAYRFVHDGRRFQVGLLPREEPAMFRDGVTASQ